MYSLLKVSFVVALVGGCFGLECLICNVNDGASCYEPVDLNNVKSLECSHFYDLDRTGNNNNTNPLTFGQRASSSDYQCIYMRKEYENGEVQLVRTCTRLQPRFCEMMKPGYFDKYKLKDCNICTSNNCNANSTINESVNNRVEIMFLTAIQMGFVYIYTK